MRRRLSPFATIIAACLSLPAIAAPAQSAPVAAITPDHAADPAVARTMGRNAEAKGSFASAERHYRYALAMTEARGPVAAREQAELLFDIAHVLDARSEHEDAEPLYRRALATALTVYGDNGAAVATYATGLAACLDAQGDHASAEEFHRRAVAIDAASADTTSSVLGVAQAGLARNLLLQGRFAEAAVTFEASIAGLEARAGSDPMVLAWSRQGLAVARDGQGRHADAEPLHREALRVASERLGASHPDLVAVYQYFADNLIALGKTEEAEDILRRSLVIVRATSHERRGLLAASLAALAVRLARDRDSRAEALVLAREAAAIARHRHARHGADRTVSHRLVADERARSRALTGFGKPQQQWRHEAFAALLIAAWLRADDVPRERDALIDEGFRAAQELGTTASGLAILAAETRHTTANTPLGGIVREQQALAARMRVLDQQLLHLLAAGDGHTADAVRIEADGVADMLARTEAQIRTRFPAYFELIAPSSASIAQVRERLMPDEAILLMVPVGEDLFSFAVTSDEVSWHRLAGGRQLTASRVARLRCQVDPDGCTLPEGAHDPYSRFEAQGYYGFDGEAAFGLYRDLIAAHGDGLTRMRRLYVTVSGPLADLPLGLLLTSPLASGQDGADPAVLAAAHWLADRHAIVRLPTISVFRSIRLTAARGAASMPFVGYGAPRLAGPAGSAPERGTPVSRGLAGDGVDLLRTLPSLPGTERELQAMSALLEAPSGALHLGLAATERSVRGNGALGLARVIAFATHGLLPHDLDGLDEPGLVFTPPDVPSNDDDGVLTASEASELTLDSEWVILSACNTASPVGTPGSVSISALARAFLYAGTRALLASHWRVADDATAALTVETLAASRRHPGITRAEAFQRAQRAVRTGRREDGSAIQGWDPSWAHPSAWAPMTLISDRDE